MNQLNKYLRSLGETVLTPRLSDLKRNSIFGKIMLIKKILNCFHYCLALRVRKDTNKSQVLLKTTRRTANKMEQYFPSLSTLLISLQISSGFLQKKRILLLIGQTMKILLQCSTFHLYEQAFCSRTEIVSFQFKMKFVGTYFKFTPGSSIFAAKNKHKIKQMLLSQFQK